MSWILDGIKSIIGDIVGLIFGGIAIIINNLLIDFLNLILDMVTTLGFSTWRTPPIQIALTFIGTLCYLMWVFSLIFVLSDIAEDVHNQNPISPVTILKNITASFLFATSAVALSGLIIGLSNSLVNSLDIGVVQNNYSNLKDQILAYVSHLQTIVTAPLALTFYIIALIVGAVAYLYYSFSIVCHNFIHSITAVMYIKPIAQGDTSAIGGWFKMSITYNLGFIIQTYMFKCAIALILSNNSAVFNINTFAGMCFIVGLFIVPKALGKYGTPMGVASLGRSGLGLAGTVGRMIR